MRRKVKNIVAGLLSSVLALSTLSGFMPAYAKAAQPKDPYTKIQGELFDEVSDNSIVTKSADKGDLWTGGSVDFSGSGWVKYNDVDFKEFRLNDPNSWGQHNVIITGATNSEVNVEIWADAIDTGTLMANVKFQNTGGLNKLSQASKAGVHSMDGVHSLYLKVDGPICIDQLGFSRAKGLLQDQEWIDFLNDTSVYNKLQIVGLSVDNHQKSVTYIDNPNGGKLQMQVIEQPNYNVITSGLTWKVDNPQTAEITQNGLLTAKKAGTVTVSVEGNIDGVLKKGSQLVDIAAADAKFKPDWDKRRKVSEAEEDRWTNMADNYEVPEWFRDAKLGIFIHWGTYAVPAYSNEWYLNHLYDYGWQSPVQNWHDDPNGGGFLNWGYKDFLPLFTASEYLREGSGNTPEDWVDIFKDAGAKYVVPVAEHHDGIAMYASEETRWNMKNVGPRADLIQPLMEATRAAGLKFGVSSHFLENPQFVGKMMKRDSYDPKFNDLYNIGDIPTREDKTEYSVRHNQMWYNRNREIIDKYNPDLFWFDFSLDKTNTTAQFLSYYYNHAQENNKDGVVVNYKWNLEPETAVYDIERGQTSDILEIPWQTDTTISRRSWGYIENDDFKRPVDLLGLLLDTVSKNGNLLLNVGPDKEGRIPEAARKTFALMGEWLRMNGEGIYSSRPWDIYGEGPTKVGGGIGSDDLSYTVEDFRFTTNKQRDTLYLYGMKWPQNTKHISINSLRTGAVDLSGLKGIRLEGSNEQITYSQGADGLDVTLPDVNPNGNGSDLPYLIVLEFDNEVPEYINLRDGFLRIEAESADNSSGRPQTGSGLEHFSQFASLGWFNDPLTDWAVFKNVDFSSKMPTTVTAVAGTEAEATVKIHLDSKDGPVIATIPLGNDGSFMSNLQIGTSKITKSVTGKHDIYLSFGGEKGIGLDYIQFSHKVSAFGRIEAEIFDVGIQGTLHPRVQERDNFSNRKNVGYLDNGSWMRYPDVDFGENGAKKVTAAGSVADGGGASLQFYIDSLNLQPFGTVTIPTNGNYDAVPLTAASEVLRKVTGVHDVYIKVNKGISIDYFEFEEASEDPLVTLLKELDRLKETALALSETEYTAETYQRLKSAIAQVDSVNRNDLQAVQEALDNLKMAIDQLQVENGDDEEALRKKVDQMNSLIKQTETLVRGDYTAESYKRVADAIEAAKRVDRTKLADLNRIISDLQIALKNLQKIPPTVKLQVPAKVKAVQTSASKVKITWEAVTRAEKYLIYRSNKSNSGYKQIGETTKLSYTDNKATCGKRWYYKIAAAKKTIGLESDMSKNAKVDVLGTPKVKVKVTSDRKLLVTWTKVKYAKGYKVYVAEKKSGKYKLKKTVKGGGKKQIKIGKMKGKKKWYVKVIAYKKNGNKNILGAWSKPKKAILT